MSHGVVEKDVHEFKLAAVHRLERGSSIGEVARALEVNPNVLHRWRREIRQGAGNQQGTLRVIFSYDWQTLGDEA